MSGPAKVSYCEVGVRASTFSLLHEIYIGEIIPVYDASVMEGVAPVTSGKKALAGLAASSVTLA